MQVSRYPNKNGHRGRFSTTSKSQDALQVALINKITKEKHESHTIRSNDNILKFLIHLAIQNNDKERFEELVQKGADISLRVFSATFL